MPEVPYRSFLSSKPFLIFGPGGRLFYAHGTLLAKCSPVLRRDVEGEMREQQLETIEIKDVDGDIDDDTVMRFVEFCYSGDYTSPDPDVVQLPTDSKELQEAFESREPQPVSQPREDEWAIPTSSKLSKKDRMKKNKRSSWFSDKPVPEPEPEPEAPIDYMYAEAVPIEEAPAPEPEPDAVLVGPTPHTVGSDRQSLWKSFSSKAYIVHRPPWQPRHGNDDREDYSGVFLCHARLYKFSDRYACSKLMELALQKLRLTLSKYKLHRQRTADVVELIRYTYTHTVDHTQGHDQLRALVLEFVVCYFRELVQCTVFLQLVQEGGPLLSDVLSEVAQLVS